MPRGGEKGETECTAAMPEVPPDTFGAALCEGVGAAFPFLTPPFPQKIAGSFAFRATPRLCGATYKGGWGLTRLQCCQWRLSTDRQRAERADRAAAKFRYDSRRLVKPRRTACA